MPLSSLLKKWDVITAGGVTCTNEDGFTFACDEDILFIVDTDPVGGEDGDGAGIGNFANT